jgi:hypothetical protein
MRREGTKYEKQTEEKEKKGSGLDVTPLPSSCKINKPKREKYTQKLTLKR